MTTRVARLTPPGAAAIATVALRGPRAWDIVRQLFRPATSTLPDDPPTPGTFRLGRFGDTVADEVVLAVRRTEPEPWLELHSHGGREVIRLLFELIEGQGAVRCSWEELERHTDPDPIRAMAAAELARATTQRTAAILLDQYNGAFTSAIAAVLDSLQRGDAVEAERRLVELVRYARVGRRLTTPWRVTVAGAPNVGKSSLVNALAGYQRSVVSATPGTTRDVVTALIAVDGWPGELSDTAGMRDDVGALEGEGIERARGAAREADLILWVLDTSEAPVWPAVKSQDTRIIINKTDLPPAWDTSAVSDAVRVSAQTGEGIADLCRSLASWLVPESPAPGAAVPFTRVLCERMEEGLARLRESDPTGARRALTVHGPRLTSV
jgi:tRNA modification GTPase